MRLELGFLRATAAIENEDEEAERRICFSLHSECGGDLECMWFVGF